MLGRYMRGRRLTLAVLTLRMVLYSDSTSLRDMLAGDTEEGYSRCSDVATQRQRRATIIK